MNKFMSSMYSLRDALMYNDQLRLSLIFIPPDMDGYEVFKEINVSRIAVGKKSVGYKSLSLYMDMLNERVHYHQVLKLKKLPEVEDLQKLRMMSMANTLGRRHFILFVSLTEALEEKYFEQQCVPEEIKPLTDKAELVLIYNSKEHVLTCAKHASIPSIHQHYFHLSLKEE